MTEEKKDEKKKPRHYTLRRDPSPADPPKDPPVGDPVCESCGEFVARGEKVCWKCEKLPIEAVPVQRPPDDFIEQLKDALDGAMIETDKPAGQEDLAKLRDQFSITDEKTAAWAAGKLAMWENEIERRQEQAGEYISDAVRTLDRLKWLFEGQLRAWAKDNLPSGKRSIKLKSATLAFRETPAKLRVVDEAKALKWAILNVPDAVQMKESLLLDPLKDFWISTGTVPDGTVVVEADENFHVKG